MWYHQTSLAWLNARQRFLTASDVYKLIPNKSGRPKDLEKKCREIYANKYKKVLVEDAVSTGAAARGHILEPHAIAAFNSACLDTKLYHWDDVVVRCLDPAHSVGFSPDALSIPAPIDSDVVYRDVLPEDVVLGEVKCFQVERHLECILADKMELEQRYQIATAMMCRDVISKAYLIFYNPSFNHCQLAWKEYTRKELSKEIEQVCEAVLVWEKYRKDIYEKLYKEQQRCLVRDVSLIINEEELERQMWYQPNS